MRTPIKDRTYISHLTALDNLESIIQFGLLPRSQLNPGEFVDTADHSILSERKQFQLDDYVPFHFHHNTSYDTIVKKTHSDKDFIYLCVKRVNARQNGFLILPIHPTSNYFKEPLPYDVGYNMIDWDTMEMNKGECEDENYRTQVRMAECIHYGRINISEIDFIFCQDLDLKNYIEGLFYKHGLIKRPTVFNNDKFFEDGNASVFFR